MILLVEYKKNWTMLHRVQLIIGQFNPKKFIYFLFKVKSIKMHKHLLKYNLSSTRKKFWSLKK